MAARRNTRALHAPAHSVFRIPHSSFLIPHSSFPPDSSFLIHNFKLVTIPNSSFNIHHSPKRGATLVELMVVFTMLTVLAVSVGRMLGAALALEQRYRNESDVMESLADNFIYAERYLSLASAIGTNGVVQFPLEAGGVSFETSHWMRVSSVSMFPSNQNFNTEIVSDDPSKLPRVTRAFSVDGKQRVARAKITGVKVEGSGNMRKLILTATGTEKDGSTYEVSAERPIRLWNYRGN